ncbi:protein of unknown function [Microbacterium sp. Nx66]|nr:protein of unknown function [Microbacterium sp. Nx66]
MDGGRRDRAGRLAVRRLHRLAGERLEPQRDELLLRCLRPRPGPALQQGAGERLQPGRQPPLGDRIRHGSLRQLGRRVQLLGHQPLVVSRHHAPLTPTSFRAP